MSAEKNKWESPNLTGRDLVIKGAQDRLNQKKPFSFKLKWEQDKYNYGYYERGNRILIANLQKYTKEKQLEIGTKEFLNGISEEYLDYFEASPFYVEGYLQAKKIYIQEKGRKAYLYTIQNNISLEDYIKVMEIIDPDVAVQDFVIGFHKASVDAYEKQIELLKSQLEKTSNSNIRK